MITICHYWIYRCRTSCGCSDIVGIFETTLMVVEVSISYTGQAITVCGIDSCAFVWKFNTCQWSIEVVSGRTFETIVI